MDAQAIGDETDVIPFAQATSGSAPNTDQLDTAGQTVLQLLRKAAGVAEENSCHAHDFALKLAEQLRAAEHRVAELEAELTACREKSDRAEQWLHRIYGEIEERFFRQDDPRRPLGGGPERSQHLQRSR